MTGLLELESIFKALEKRFSPNIAEMNKEAVRAGYDEVEVIAYGRDEG